MDWTSLIGPAVVAAVIAGIVSVITLLMNRATTLTTHSQRLEFEREQAERRSNAEIALAERKFALDRALEAWKRKTEFAEQVLADFYEAQRIIAEARSPGTPRDEGTTRQKLGDETEEETQTLNAYFASVERLNNKREFFAQLHARRYRFLAYFGRDAAKPYDDLHRVYAEILVAVKMLIMTHRQRGMGFTPQAIGEWKTTIGWGLPENDRIPARLDLIVEAIEETCRPVIQELHND